MQPNRRNSVVRFVLAAAFVVSTSVLAHEDGDLSPIGPPGKPRNRVQALNGYRDGLHAQALNGFRDASRAQALNGYRDGAGAKALNGYRDDSGAKALNGYRDDAGAKALNGYRDGSGAKALNGYRDGAGAKALNGYRDDAGAKALNGYRDGAGAKALNGYRDDAGAKALNGYRDDAGAKALNGYRDDAGAKALNGYRDGSGVKALNGFRDQDDPLTSWISSERALQEDRLELAHYIVQCAMAPGDDRAVHVDGETYTLRGVFGLLPSWTSGEAMTDSEYELLTACLGAHVNPLGKHVPISIRGPGIRLDPGEAELFPVREAAFFALHDGSGALATYACSGDSGPYQGDDSRLCSEPGRCLSVVGLGSCRGICVPDDEGYFRCSTGGLEISGVLTTYMQAREG